MRNARGTPRQQVQSYLGGLLPPTLSLPLRSRFGASREPELAALPALVRPGETVIDVGAHRGVYAYQLARLVGTSGHVIAYEPQPAMVRYLSAASRRGVMSRVELRTTALSDTEGEAVLSIPFEDGVRVIGQATLRELGAGAEEHRVRVAVLDREPMPGRIAFMKIDIEGHELALLRGARELLARDQPTMLIEVETRHAGPRVAELAALLLDDLGYSASEWIDGKLVPVTRKRWDSDDLNRSSDGRYVNNFVFSQ